MVLKTYEQIKQFIAKSNFFTIEFDLISAGKYKPVDAEWNYKDINHTNFVHTKLESMPTTIADDIYSAIHFQKIFGINFPMMLTQYAKENSIIYYSTLFFFIILVKTTISEKDNITIVTTKYNISGPNWSKFLIFLLKKIAIKNYNILMSEDLPLRERKYELREFGYKYTHDNNKIGWLNLFNLNNNVIISANINKFSLEIELNKLNDGDNLVGNSDHYGLRIINKNLSFSIYPRMCLHEGACLDGIPLDNSNFLNCPWHGKKHNKIIEFSITDKDFSYEDNYRIIKKVSSILYINCK
jgi:hypothetical protein